MTDIKLNNCPCCDGDKIEVYYESIETNGVVSGWYLAHFSSPLVVSKEQSECEVGMLDFQEWYDTKEEAILDWNSGNAIRVAREERDNRDEPDCSGIVPVR
jgi:hypothetical protein